MEHTHSLCLRYDSVPGRSLHPADVSIQLIGEGLFFRCAEWWWPPRLEATGAERFHEVPHVEPSPDIVLGVGLPPRIQGLTPFCNDFCG